MEGPIFLTLEHVLRLHDRQIKRFGGAEGIHDLELNGLDTDAIDESEMEALTCAVAEGKADKHTAAEFFRGNIVERSE